MSATETESEDAPTETSDGAATTGRAMPWYLTTRGAVVFVVDAVLVLLAVAGTTGFASTTLEAFSIEVPDEVMVDGFVYVYALLGALGYVFTALVRDFERTASDLVKYNVRMLAALPLAAGVYLLSGLLFGDIPTNKMMAGAAFVAGLYVNLVFDRIGALADRMFRTHQE